MRTVYSPAGRPLKVYAPSAWVVAVRSCDAAAAGPVSVTVAAGTIAPEVSVNTPRSEPVEFCAATTPAKSTIAPSVFPNRMSPPPDEMTGSRGAAGPDGELYAHRARTARALGSAGTHVHSTKQPRSG